MFFFTMISCSGYMSPEYAIHGKFSVKSDVFSLGVLLLEIVSGKRNTGFSHPDHHHCLLGHVSITHSMCKYEKKKKTKAFSN